MNDQEYLARNFKLLDELRAKGQKYSVKAWNRHTGPDSATFVDVPGWVPGCLYEVTLVEPKQQGPVCFEANVYGDKDGTVGACIVIPYSGEALFNLGSRQFREVRDGDNIEGALAVLDKLKWLHKKGNSYLIDSLLRLAEKHARKDHD